MTYRMNTDKTWSETKAEIATCFNRWARETGRSITYLVKANTTRYMARNLDEIERSATVIYTHPVSGEEKRLTLSKFDRPVDNLRALYLGLEAIRLNEARGLGEVFAQNYAALPAPAASRRDPYEVLGIRPDAAPEIVEAAYRKERFGLVTVEGALYEIVDIGMRMLTPRELFRAQGFPEGYIIDPMIGGKRLSKTAQIRMCGNAVCPDMSRALVAANVASSGQSELWRGYELAAAGGGS